MKRYLIYFKYVMHGETVIAAKTEAEALEKFKVNQEPNAETEVKAVTEVK